MVAAELRRRGVHVETLDGDEVRKHLSRGLGFSREDRDANIRRIGFVAKLVARSGGCAIAAAISPYVEIRNEIRRSIDRFCEVYTECPIEVLAERDPKGLYKKALAGEIKNFTGVDDPYQAPESPEVHLRTDLETPEQSLAHIVSRLEALGFIPTRHGTTGQLTDLDGGLLPPHGEDLVDRVLRGDLLTDAKQRAVRLPELIVDATAAAELSFIACGAYSPIKGFVNGKDYLRVVNEARLENGIPWAMPIVLPIDDAAARALQGATEVALRNPQRELLGLLTVQDLFETNPDLEAERLLGTTDASRREVARIMARPRMALGGEIWSTGLHDLPGGVRIQTPREVRLQMARQGWRRVTAVEVEGPPTIADEYIARVGLELSDGLLWFYRFGMDDFVPLSERHRCIEAVIEGYLARDHVLALPLLQHDAAPPRHALHVAICAQNFGASELLVQAAADVSARRPERLADHEPELVVDLVAYASPGAASHVGHPATAYSAPSVLTKPPPVPDLVEEARRGRASQWFRKEVAEILAKRD